MTSQNHIYDNVEQYDKLSPYQMKDVLVNVASEDATDRAVLNAGRGNPNFLATIPRHGFFQLGLFAMQESEQSFVDRVEGTGGFPRHEGIKERFEHFLCKNNDVNGISYLREAVSYVHDQLGLDPAKFLYEMCEGILGCNYLVPNRMLPLSEKIVAHHLCHEINGIQVKHVSN